MLWHVLLIFLLNTIASRGFILRESYSAGTLILEKASLRHFVSVETVHLGFLRDIQKCENQDTALASPALVCPH